ncbi:hypothetical protein DPEC_G00097980 [Dallia pectoralis]|uniref:Uncharacterized protein n=1 Tax=Dallia pectoralis TaxID=75939 RepID=A0ACC2GW28_DALPE|nr:hypothetical protein DPEC_G00097980 [Dallia pectoralis]
MGTILVWEVETTVRQAQSTQPDPGGGPAGCLFVPDQARSAVLDWGHSSSLACHPGSRRTLAFIRRRFWWPSMVKDVPEFVAACAACAQGKTPRQDPSGLLQPLPIPRRPWSHVSL